MSPTSGLLLKVNGRGPAAPYLPVAKSKSKGKRERKERAAAAESCCGRSVSTNMASSEQPTDPGSAGPKWAGEEQHWVPLFNTIPEVPTLVSSHDSRNSCDRLRQRKCRGNAKNVTSRAVLNPSSPSCLSMRGSHSVYGPDENSKLTKFSTVELVSSRFAFWMRSSL